MRNYELTIVMAGKATPVKKKSLIEKIGKFVKSEKGKIEKSDDWGKLELSSPIGENETGIYLHFQLKLEPSEARDLDSKLNLEEGILRYLLVRKDQKLKIDS